MKVRRNSLLILVAVSVAILALALARSRAQPARSHAGPEMAYKLADGPYIVDTTDQTWHDAKRNKDLPVRILFPTSGGPFPVIVFSHGAGGSGQNYFPLTHHWATHGYVVIQPTHNDSIALRREKGESLPSGPRDLVEDYLFNYEDWIDRAHDITFVMDSLADLEKRLPVLKGKLDQKRIGVGGHSYGAFTTQMIGGVTLDIPGGKKAQNFGDERPRALLLLSPQGKSANGLSESSWRHVTRPMMTMTGSKDGGVMGQLASWRKDPYTYSQPPDKYLVWIEDAFHMSFTGALTQPNNRLSSRPIISRMISQTDQQAVFDYVKVASIAFWDAYLKNEPQAKTYLRSDSLVKYSDKKVKLDQK